ncbi:nickel ABC transporter substrate-binding protein [Eubacteriales bacterium KG127]
MRVNFKKLITFTLIGVMVFTLVACGNTLKDKGDDKVLTLAFNEDSTGDLNPHMYLPSQFITQDMVYEGLVYYGEKGEIKPSLAEKWDVSKDGKTYTFYLRKNVKFSDGSDFNSSNVVKNFDAIFSEANKGNHEWFAFTGLLDSYKAIDEYTFQINLKTAYSATLYDLAMIRPIRMLGNAGFPVNGDTSKGIKAPIGTGPWVLKEHKNNEYAIYSQNKYYWGDKPASKEVKIKVIPDNETMAIEFEAGNIDLVYGNGLISLDRFNSYKKDKKYVTASSEPMSTRLLLLNTTKGALKDVKVRQALSYAIDKKSVSENIFGGIDKPADTIFAPNVPNTNVKLKKYAFNLKEAEKLLDEAGWKKGADGIREKAGEKLHIYFPYIASKGNDKSVGEYIQGEWKKIGVDVELKAMEEKAHWANASKGDFDVIQNFSWGAPWDPHAFLQSMAAKSDNGGPDYAAQQGIPIKTKLDETIKQLLIEPDKDKMKAEYEYVLSSLNDEAVYIPITYQALTSVYRAGELKDVEFMPEENRLPVWKTMKVK